MSPQMDAEILGQYPAELTIVTKVQHLILELYQPGPPQKIAKIQETLQRFQKSAQGWQLASKLLESSDEKVKFFGALTFTVKLNLDSESLSSLQAKSLLTQLINWLIRCLNQKVGPLVIRKNLIHSLYVGEAVTIDWLDQAQDLRVVVEKLSIEEASAALWFGATLAEEVGKTDVNNIKHHKFHDDLKSNVVDIVVLIKRCLMNISQSGPPKSKLRQEAMKCFQSWVLYSHRAFIDPETVLGPLRTLTSSAISCLVEDEMYEVTVELFSDILSNYSKFLGDEDLQLLLALFNSRWSSERYERLLLGNFDFESVQFGQLMIAYGDAIVQELPRKGDHTSQQFLAALVGLLAAKGYAIAEDRVFAPALEFWSTFVEVLIDSMYSEGEAELLSLETSEDDLEPRGSQSSPKSSGVTSLPWFRVAKSYVFQAIDFSWRKIQYPPPEIFDSWDQVDRIGFSDARKDVADLLQSSYTLIGPPLFSSFSHSVIQSLENTVWEELEASLFCLGALADCIDQDACDDNLTKIFASTFFGVLLDEETQALVRTRQTALSLIGQYNGYFERHTEYLADALTFLFNALSYQTLLGTTSRSIQSLCSACRHALVNELGVFLQKYDEFSSRSGADGLAKERIMSAMATIVQAISPEEERKRPVAQLLHFIERDLGRCLRLIAAGNSEDAEPLAVDTLRCLACMAKGLQAPTDVPVDLDRTGNSAVSQFWITGDGAIVQSRVRMIIERLVAFLPQSGDVIEVSCSTIRAGFTERLAGPFVLAPDSVVDFLLKAGLHTPRIGSVISTASSLVSSCSVEPSRRIDDALRRLFAWLRILLEDLGEPANDPEIAQVGIDFVYRLLSAYANIFVEQPSASLEYFFLFALRALVGRDPLPKSAAADFWGHFISLTNVAGPWQAPVQDMIERMGPHIAEALVYNISGNAARSELDKVSDPLRKLVFSQVFSRSWLENALSKEMSAVKKTSEKDRRVFLQKIIRLRGARQTNQVVKDFWLSCRGTSFAYTS